MVILQFNELLLAGIFPLSRFVLTSVSRTRFCTNHSQLLLVNGVYPDTGASEIHPSALWKAVRASDAAIVEMLIAHGADVNRSKYYGYETVAFYAAANGDAEMVKLLAAHGGDVDSERHYGLYNGTPLHEAVTNRYIAVVRVLLDLGVRVNEEDSNCETPLEIAKRLACVGGAVQGQRELMVEMRELLVNAGAHARQTEEGEGGILSGEE